MFYIMSDDGELIESVERCPTTDELAELADECDCDLWVIRGEHAGITYERPEAKSHKTTSPRPAFAWDG